MLNPKTMSRAELVKAFNALQESYRKMALEANAMHIRFHKISDTTDGVLPPGILICPYCAQHQRPGRPGSHRQPKPK